MSVHTDCYAYAKRVKPDGRTCEVCKALNMLYCQTEECKFYKTAEQACRECTYADCENCVNPNAVIL